FHDGASRWHSLTVHRTTAGSAAVVLQRKEHCCRLVISRGGGGRHWCWLADGRSGLDDHAEIERADFDPIAVLKGALSLHAFIVHEGAVGAVEVANEGLTAPHQDGTGPFADEGAGRPRRPSRR